jgi:hypothetical protein|tara:strand:- start:221 stop:661 length:441 start_codon:yes stop_codon:yes gene_type:complete
MATTEIEVGGVKFTGGKMFAVVTALSALVGSLYGGFEVYKDYTDMKAKIASYEAPDLSGIEKEVALAVGRASEAVDYTRDIKDTLRSDIIQLEKDNRLMEKENRIMVREAQVWFDDRTSSVDTKLRELEERMDTKIRRALDNPLVK